MSTQSSGEISIYATVIEFFGEERAVTIQFEVEGKDVLLLSADLQCPCDGAGVIQWTDVTDLLSTVQRRALEAEYADSHRLSESPEYQREVYQWIK